MEDIPTEPIPQQKFLQYTLDHKPLGHKINGEDCYTIQIVHKGLLGRRMITMSEIQALRDVADDTSQLQTLLEKYWADSPKTAHDI